MKLALIQEKQNGLYLFNNQEITYTKQEIMDLQQEMIDQNLELLKVAGQNHVDIALTSEAINFPGQPGKCTEEPKKIILRTQNRLIQSCREIAKQGEMYLIAGMFRIKEDGKLYNSAVIFDRTGEIIFSYDKNFLAGEENDYLESGNGFPVWESEFGKIGIGICWDMQFPETARIYAQKDVDLILCPTWGWEHFYNTCRAYENGIYVAAAMAIPAWKDIEGKRISSQVIAPDGTILAQGGKKEKEVLYCNIQDIRDSNKTREYRMKCLKEHLDLSGEDKVIDYEK